MNTAELDLFFPDTHSPFLLGIGDSSFYPDGFNIINPTIEVSAPTYNKVIISLQSQGFTVINSNDLGITCDATCSKMIALPDGVWEITYTVAPANVYTVTKKFLRVSNLLRRFELAFLNSDIMECNSNTKLQDMETIDEIDAFIQGAIATANDCNYIKAMELYREADKILKNFLKTKC